MKSTKRILQIIDKYGVDDKRLLMKELKALRREIKAELMRHIDAGIQRAKNEYLDDLKPGQKFSSINHAEHSTQNWATLAINS